MYGILTEHASDEQRREFDTSNGLVEVDTAAVLADVPEELRDLLPDVPDFWAKRPGQPFNPAALTADG